MDKTSNTLVEKENRYLAGDLGAVGIGAALAGPIGAAAGLAGNKLYRWLRGKYLSNKNKNKTSDDTIVLKRKKDKGFP